MPSSSPHVFKHRTGDAFRAGQPTSSEEVVSENSPIKTRPPEITILEYGCAGEVATAQVKPLRSALPEGQFARNPHSQVSIRGRPRAKVSFFHGGEHDLAASASAPERKLSVFLRKNS
jgi:hypothetical protein